MTDYHKSPDRREFLTHMTKTAMACSILSSIPVLSGRPIDKKVSLSPSLWSEKERERFWKLNRSVGQSKPLARSRKGIVIGTTNAFAVRAGMEALLQGGNSMDAAITTALVHILMEVKQNWVSRKENFRRDSSGLLKRWDNLWKFCNKVIRHDIEGTGSVSVSIRKPLKGREGLVGS